MISFDSVLNFFSSQSPAWSWIRLGLLILLGTPGFYYLGNTIRVIVTRRYSRQYGMIAGKGVTYTGLAVIAITAFHELGFNLGPLLGAAGIVGVALGFASQTSVSNIISGIFLIAEEPFEVGDVIEVGTTRGEVLSVDLISVKVRTFDNRLVRIPNETLVKTEITNLTKFPIRRLDITVSIAYKEDFQRVKNILLDIARKNQYCLQEPEALVHLTAFAESAVSILFAVWTPTSERARVKSLIQEEVKARFDKEGIEIPFPHLSLYAGSKSEPFEVRIERTPA